MLEFNPWRWGGDDNISRAFFREIAAALGETDKSLAGRQRAYEFRRYGKLLGHVSGALKSAGDRTPSIVGWLMSVGLLTAGAGLLVPGLPATKVAAVLLLISGFVSLAAKVLSAAGVERDADKPIELLRASLETKLKTLPKNLLVIIDDIDRLEPDQIRLVIRHVKANANLPRITFLLLFQREIVEKALDPVSEGDGRRYLEKIVQATFDIPVVEGAQIEAVVLNSLTGVVGDLTNDETFDQTRWGNLWGGALRHFFRNLRDAKRYVGSVSVHLNLHRGSRVFETNLIDLLALESLRVFEPGLFDQIAHSKHLLTGFDKSESDKEATKALVKLAHDDNCDGATEMLKQLFPVAGWAFGGSSYGPDWNEQWVRARRACSKRHFDRYFGLRLPDGQISNSEFLEFIEQSSDRQSIDAAFRDFDRRGLLPVLIERLDEINKNLPISHAYTLLPALFDVAERYSQSLGFSGSTPYISAWRTASWYLRSEPDLQRRGELFLDAMRNSEGLLRSRYPNRAGW